MVGTKQITLMRNFYDEADNAIYTAYVIFDKQHLITLSMDNLKKLESWILAKLDDYSTSFGLILDHAEGKVVAKYNSNFNNSR